MAKGSLICAGLQFKCVSCQPAHNLKQFCIQLFGLPLLQDVTLQLQTKTEGCFWGPTVPEHADPEQDKEEDETDYTYLDQHIQPFAHATQLTIGAGMPCCHASLQSPPFCIVHLA